MKLLLLILDSADCQLIEQLCEQGDLPFLADFRLRNSTQVTNDPDLYSVSTCFNLTTGLQVKEHKQYSWSLYDRSNGKTSRINSSLLANDTIFKDLDHRGVRQLLIDIPRMPLLSLKNGLQVVDWYPHDQAASTLTTTPDAVSKLIRDNYGEDPFFGNCDTCDIKDIEQGNHFATQIQKRIENKTSFILNELNKSSYDLAAISFGDTHCVGHQCWHFHDVNHQHYSPNLNNPMDNPVTKVYRYIDDSISQICQHWDGNIAILANMGMQANHSNNGLMKIALERFNKKVPYGRNRLAKCNTTPSTGKTILQQSFALPISHSAFAVRVNVKDRDPNGVISPGKEYQSYVLEMIQEILALRSMSNQEPLFLSHTRWTDAHGENLRHDFPDITFTWNNKAITKAAASTYLGLIYSPFNSKRTGTHSSDSYCWTNIQHARLPESIADYELLPYLLQQSQ